MVGTPIYIRVEDREGVGGAWDLEKKEISVWGPKGKVSPELLGHEVAHARLKDQVTEEEEPWDIFLAELRAWDLALSRAPSGEYRKDIVEDSLEDYILLIDTEYELEDVRKAERMVRKLLGKHRSKFS